VFDPSGYPAGPWLGFFLACAYAILVVLGDSITTMIGLGKGDVEGNFIERWLFKKVGSSFATFLTGVLFLFSAAAIANANLKAGFLYVGIVSAGETYQTIKNYRLLKKQGIKL
jgi:hypothetical protein